MALNKRSLIRVASIPYQSGGTTKKQNRYAYATTDALSSVVANNYFADIRDTLQVGDVIEVTAGLGATTETELIRMTAVPATGNVTSAVAIAYPDAA